MKNILNFLRNWFMSLKNIVKSLVIMLSIYGIVVLIQRVVEIKNPETPVVGIIGFILISLGAVCVYGWQEGWHLEAKKRIEKIKDKYDL